MTFPGLPYRLFLLYLLRLPCHFYLIAIEQQHILFFFLGKRYDLRSEEISAINTLRKNFRIKAGKVILIPLMFPKLFKLIPKFIRDNFFGGSILDHYLSTMRNIFNVSIIFNIDYYVSENIYIRYFKIFKSIYRSFNYFNCRLWFWTFGPAQYNMQHKKFFEKLTYNRCL